MGSSIGGMTFANGDRVRFEAWTHSSVSGAEETCSDAGLKVDDMTLDTLTLGAGARVQALVGEDIYNRSSPKAPPPTHKKNTHKKPPPRSTSRAGVFA